MEESKNPMFNAELKVTLQLGGWYIHKDHEGLLWRLTEKKDHSCKLTHEDPVTGASQALEVAAGDIIGKLKISKAKPPKLWPSADLSKSFLNVTAEEEHRKASIYLLLWEAYHSKAARERLLYVWCLWHPTTPAYFDAFHRPSLQAVFCSAQGQRIWARHTSSQDAEGRRPWT